MTEPYLDTGIEESGITSIDITSSETFKGNIK